MSQLRSLTALVVTLILLAISGATATADESAVPAAGVVTVDGRGYGHGRGMSQWGARGAAASGLTWQQITEFYYPGTVRHDQGNTPIRVWISADQDGVAEVTPPPLTEPATDLLVRSGTQSVVLPAGAAYDRWRVRRSGTGFTLEKLDGATWTTHPTTFPLAGDVGFSTTSGLVRLVLPDGTRQELRGEVRAVLDGTGQRTVAAMPMESYLRAVVPAEMPGSWPAQALASQAVAARTYASRLRADRPATATYDTCDTISCQVFTGTARYRADDTLISRGEQASTDAAIEATARIVLRYTPAGTTTPKVAFTEFSSSNGGWTVSGGTAHPYMVAKADPYDGVVPSAAHAWTAKVAASTIESNLVKRGFSVGVLRRISITQRNGHGEMGGRILAATVTGSTGSASLTGAQLRLVMGTKSEWFQFIGPSYTRDWSGDQVGDVLGVDRNGRLLLYPGNQTGSFSSSRQVGSGWQGLDLVTQVGDWDGDGRQDIIGRLKADGSLRLYRGNGRGGFLSNAKIGHGWHGFDVLVAPGDWNGDGAADLLARRSADGVLWLYPGSGSGGFGRATALTSGWNAMGVITAVGDWNGDGKVDLVARKEADSSLELRPGNGTGGFLGTTRIGTGWSTMNRLFGPGDWNGDGHHDILARRTDGGLYLYPGNGAGGFGRSRQIGTGWGGLSLLG